MRKVLVLAMLMMTLAASMAAAAKGEFLMGGEGGMTIPTGDLDEFADPGFAAGVFGDYGIANNCTVGLNIIYHGYGVPDDIITGLGATDASFSVIQFTANTRYFFSAGEQLMPFVTAGGGIYNGKTKVEGGTFASDESSSKGGFYGGLGADYAVNHMWSVGLEGDYHYVLDAASDSSGSDSAATFFGVMGRLKFSFAAQTQ